MSGKRTERETARILRKCLYYQSILLLAVQICTVQGRKS